MFKINDSNDLKEKIIYLVENKEIREKMSAEIEEFYKNHYDFENVVEEYTNLYDEINRTSLR